MIGGKRIISESSVLMGFVLHSLGNGNNKLKNPFGVCVSGQYVYVTDITIQCVSVFTTDGVYVTSFGQHGNKEGDFNYLYIDKCHFVYVSDTWND